MKINKFFILSILCMNSAVGVNAKGQETDTGMRIENTEKMAQVGVMEVPKIKVSIKDLKVPEGKEVILDVHIVKKGEYLSKIAKREYGNKDLWTVIYSYNKFIKDSHWIFPGDKIVLPRIVDKLPDVPSQKKAGEEVDRNEEKRNYGNFIAPDDFEFVGTIVGFKLQKAINAQGDYLFIDIGKNVNLKRRQRLNIYRTSQYIAHPYTGEILGNVVELIGEIEVTADIEEKNATAKVIYSAGSVETGDMLLYKY